jgi:chromosomal replication initiator protein
MYLIRDLLGTQLVEIGTAFGGRDHSTVIHSLEKVEATLEANHEFRARIHHLRSTLHKLQS